jgi:hypothetical protein
MSLQCHPAKRLTVILGESDMYQHTPLAIEIVNRAHGVDMPGVSVFRGIEGYGSRRSIHTTRLLSMSDDLPMMIVIVGTPDRIAEFLPQIAPLLDHGLITVEDTEIVFSEKKQDQ